ncbi:hypothetical protein D3C86_1847690 [compost metagenome]
MPLIRPCAFRALILSLPVTLLISLKVPPAANIGLPSEKERSETVVITAKALFFMFITIPPLALVGPLGHYQLL